MCTLVILRRPGDAWPLIVAANRDEMANRPWAPPGRHWRDRMEVTGGVDQLAGGTWLGVNRYGLVAGVLNRTGSLGPDPSLRSRGELPLEALDHAEAEAVAEALFDIDPHAYRPFNMFVADNREAFWISSLNKDGRPGIRLGDIPSGLSMLTDMDLNDSAHPRVRHYKGLFEAAPPPDPGADDWSAWQALLGSRESEDGAGPEGAMTIDRDDGFGTVSASIIAVPSPDHIEAGMRWQFAPGPPDRTPFEAVRL